MPEKSIVSEAFRRLVAPRQSALAYEALVDLERSKDPKKFARAMTVRDKRDALGRIEFLEHGDRATLNREALVPIAASEQAVHVGPAADIAALLVHLAGIGQLGCNCVTPFKFESVTVGDAMSGPELTDVRNGVMGAFRRVEGEYTVTNTGETDTTTRVSRAGSISINFSAAAPASGNYYLLLPGANLLARGYTRVIGHGNYSTSYDAKVFVDTETILEVGSLVVENTLQRVHDDGTRSEDRTTFFDRSFALAPRWVRFQAGANALVSMKYVLVVDTEANVDGLAIGVVNRFGFLANSKNNYGTLLIRAN